MTALTSDVVIDAEQAFGTDGVPALAWYRSDRLQSQANSNKSFSEHPCRSHDSSESAHTKSMKMHGGSFTGERDKKKGMVYTRVCVLTSRQKMIIFLDRAVGQTWSGRPTTAAVSVPTVELLRQLDGDGDEDERHGDDLTWRTFWC
jgi:hypothetical protein